MPDQRGNIVHLFLNRTFLQGVLFIRAYSEHLNCLNLKGQKFFVGKHVVVVTIIHSDPVGRHRVAIGIETGDGV
ncbi:hypothetical protein CY34DRAFT_808206 [Suillus luteus UH-Slu-Lm8-n1]|uniref:Uncharacterized protein n=1 Tax=Suillus luteus UH-Slu-Lm8-n1 TaxID=930992 RepID=A0A0D0B6S5_9AGAM|nr:hypothetical protein CY34DRAFT_808206 [Suillus luteus UH-Slu-Lm8-n1]